MNRGFYEKVVPHFFEREDCPLTTHVGINSLILRESISVRSLMSHLGDHKIMGNLWRGSRDGFRCYDFHRLCDDRGKTLTVIKTTEGSVFGGFTDISWQSPQYE